MVRRSLAKRVDSSMSSAFNSFRKNKNDSSIANFECQRTPASSCGCRTYCGETPLLIWRVRRRTSSKSWPPAIIKCYCEKKNKKMKTNTHWSLSLGGVFVLSQQLAAEQALVLSMNHLLERFRWACLLLHTNWFGVPNTFEKQIQSDLPTSIFSISYRWDSPFANTFAAFTVALSASVVTLSDKKNKKWKFCFLCRWLMKTNLPQQLFICCIFINFTLQ